MRQRLLRKPLPSNRFDGIKKARHRRAFLFRPSERDAMEFVLITHEREAPKPSNTGRLLLAAEGVKARQVLWARKAPDDSLLEDIRQGRALLVYPLLGAEGHRLECLEEKDHHCSDNSLAGLLPEKPVVVLIDATWQQAQKMFNQSPYLQQLPRLELARERPSQFWLRRNQKSAGLCTVECAIEILRLTGDKAVADGLEAGFMAFLRQPRC